MATSHPCILLMWTYTLQDHVIGQFDTPCKTMVLLSLGLHVVASTGRVMQCPVAACTLLFRLGRGYTPAHECALGVTHSSSAM